ncbi:MAG: CocE/NonD family hydrolase [Planctomycetaceae bacterium]
MDEERIQPGIHGRLRRFAVIVGITSLLIASVFSSAAADDRWVHHFGYLPISDGIEIAYTLYRPSPQGRYPTLLIYNMYDASIVAPDWNQTISTEVSDYLAAGYAVMGANARGTGCSSGVEDPLHAEQGGRDGAEVVEWIARQPWSDGCVGMFGHSGSGITQFYVAAHNPGPLKAIIPGAAPADIYRDIGYPGGIFNYAFMYMWSQGAQREQSERAARVHIDHGDTKCAETIRERPPNPTWDQMRQRPQYDDWHAQHSVNSVASRINVPTYVVFGWQDQSVLSTAVRVFDRLQGPRKMLVAEGTHSFYIRSMEVRREKIRFFNHWLKGEANGAMAGKPIKVWLSMRGKIESVPDRVAEIDQLPVPGTRWTQFFLAKDRTLTKQEPTESITADYLYPAGATYVYGEAGYPHKPAKIGGLIFRTEPFAEETVLLGPTVVHLYGASTQADTTFLVVLSEVDPIGESTYLQRGYLRASMSRVGPTSTAAEPVYPFDRQMPLEPGKVQEFVIELHPTGSIIEPGHSLEVMVMAPTMAPEPIGGWGFVPAEMGVNTIHMSPRHPSHLLLPIVDPESIE